MRIVKSDKEVGDIKTAVIYKFNYFLSVPEEGAESDPDYVEYVLNDDPKKFEPYKVLYYGNSRRFSGIDFAEYDFNAVLENLKFNNKDLISYLDKESISSLGSTIESSNELDNLMLAESTIFPTLSKDGTKNNVEYFGSLSLTSMVVYLFNVDPGCYKIELYDEVLSGNMKNSSTGNEFFRDCDYYRVLGITPRKEPVITIYLGPDEKLTNNPGSMYYNNINPNIEDPDAGTEEELEYSKQYDEIYSGKAVWLVVASDNTIKELNLSYNAWRLSEDANIYKSKFNLRNDDFHKIINSPNTVKELDYQVGFVDRRNGKLLGNQILLPNLQNPDRSMCPILSKKLYRYGINRFQDENGININSTYTDFVPGKVYSNGEIYKKGREYYRQVSDGEVSRVMAIYDPEVEYGLGEEVLFPTKTSSGITWNKYVAVRRGNRGHFPGLSSYWSLQERTTDLFTTRIAIMQSPIDKGGTINPSKYITLVDEDNTGDIDFEISPSNGYEFNSILVDEDTTLSPLNYTVVDVVDESNYFKHVTIKESGWKEILNNGSNKKQIIFKFNPIQSVIEMKYYRNGIEGIIDIPIEGLDNKSRDVVPGSSYLVVLCAMSLDGVRYTITEEIIEQLSKVMVTSKVDLEFALVDDMHTMGISRFISGSITKETSGSIKEEALDISALELSHIDSWEYVNGEEPLINVPLLKYSIDDVDFNKLLINLGITNKLFVTISSYDGFEVSIVRQEIEYGEPTSIQFYSTYGDSNLEKVELIYKVNGKDAVIDIMDVGSSPEDSPVKYTLSKSGTMYTLTLSEITTDIDIKLFEK